MALSQKYVKTLEPALINYDFRDITKLTGYVQFYATKIMDSSGVASGSLVTNAISGISNAIPSYGVTKFQTQFAAVAGEINFDTETAIPLYLNGYGQITIPIEINNQGSTGAVSIGVSCAIASLDSSGTETIVSDWASGAITSDSISSGGNGMVIWGGKFFINNKTVKAGDKLRLKTRYSNPGANRYTNVLHDPENRTYTSPIDIDTSVLSVLIPFKIDL